MDRIALWVFVAWVPVLGLWWLLAPAWGVVRAAALAIVAGG